MTPSSLDHSSSIIEWKEHIVDESLSEQTSSSFLIANTYIFIKEKWKEEKRRTRIVLGEISNERHELAEKKNEQNKDRCQENIFLYLSFTFLSFFLWNTAHWYRQIQLWERRRERKKERQSERELHELERSARIHTANNDLFFYY